MTGCSGSMGEKRDCSEILGRMFIFLDNELDQVGCAEIQKHLDECAPCLGEYEIERTVKSLVSRSCSEVTPEGLKKRISMSLQEIRVRTGGLDVE